MRNIFGANKFSLFLKLDFTILLPFKLARILCVFFFNSFFDKFSWYLFWIVLSYIVIALQTITIARAVDILNLGQKHKFYFSLAKERANYCCNNYRESNTRRCHENEAKKLIRFWKNRLSSRTIILFFPFCVHQ